MEIVFKFIEGEVSYNEFKNNLLKNDDIFDWLQSLLNDKMLNDSEFYCCSLLRRKRHSVKICVMDYLGEQIGDMYDVHSFISKYVQYVFSNQQLNITTYYKEMYNIHLCAVSDSYGGEEVDKLISDFILNIPKDFSNTKKIKIIKEKMKELFPGKRPCWVQEAEWPAFNGKPMLYIRRERDGDLFKYIFEDQETGTKRIVEQFA